MKTLGYRLWKVLTMFACSYNVRYGPSELITNHENGILVKKMTSKGLRMQWKWLEIFISKM